MKTKKKTYSIVADSSPGFEKFAGSTSDTNIETATIPLNKLYITSSLFGSNS